ncbi:MAG: penicillin-binding protein 2 [Granulosicoccaceae bacterium]|jgi:penicillin-binding protein 2
MPRHLRIKDQAVESRLFNRRAITALVLIIIVLLGVFARLFWLQILHHEHFSTLSRNNRVKLVPIPPTRGLIFDRTGTVLAENIPSFSLEVIPEQVDDMDATIAALREVLPISDSDIEHFQRLLRQKRHFDSIPLRYRLNEQEVAHFAVNRHRFNGVDIRARLTRHYPHGTLTAHVVGYVGRIDEKELQRIDAANYSATTHIGKLGIERSYEDVLHGTVGYQQEEVNAQGRRLRVLQEAPPIPGKNLYLNIDLRLQQLANEALEDYRGSVVAIVPDSGEVIAMVSKPGYDPNLFVNGIDVQTYAELRQSRDKPLFNRTLLGQYPPGSTLKPFIGLAGLEHGHGNNKVVCRGWYELKGDERKYRDWKKGGHGITDLSAAITESCDVYFYDLAQQLNIDRMSNFLARFGFGEKTGIDVLGERSGLLPSREWKRRARNEVWYPGETLITGIGQGFTLVTPMQLATTTATLAARGKRVKPRLLHALQGAENELPVIQPPIELPAVALKHKEHWDAIIRAMENVLHGPRGTARGSAVGLEYRLAGKTGTAQVFGIAQDEEYDASEIAERLRDHALFIAFAPAADAKLAIAVIAENAGSGSAVAAPIARRIMDAYLQGENRK